jgi:hypothetical protein
MKLAERGPIFLLVGWEAPGAENEEAITFQATLCRDHRQTIWDQYEPNTWGCRRLGDSCDFCEGRGPRRA